MGEHFELIERLKAATEGSRELDREMMLLAGDAREVDHCTFYGPDERVWCFGEYEHETDLPPLPYLTSSLDAIVGLIERNGWRLNSVDASVRLRTSVGLKSVDERHVDIPDENRSAWMYDYAGGAAKTLPLALCIALLSALQQGGAEQ